MPDQRAKDKRKLNLWLTRETYEKLTELAKRQGKTKSELVTAWIAVGVKDIQLTKEQYEEIAKYM